MEQPLKTYTKAHAERFFSEREGETKLGQSIHFANGISIDEALRAFNGQFVIVGIPEDIGVRANLGKKGTADFFPSFLGAFLSVQDNEFFNGKNILLLGEVECADVMKEAENTTAPEKLSRLVEMVDARVQAVLEKIFAHNKIPVVIGGGHNNSYPIIAAYHAQVKKKINILNIDPHADLRSTERRHSGNGFSYALEKGFISSYFQIGLHENYNNTTILERYKSNPGITGFWSYDDYLRSKWNFEKLFTFIRDNYTDAINGFELDMDSIEGMPCSAATPSGFSSSEIRQLVMKISELTRPVYFHLPEAGLSEHYNSAKMMTYLVTDFIKSYR